MDGVANSDDVIRQALRVQEIRRMRFDQLRELLESGEIDQEFFSTEIGRRDVKRRARRAERHAEQDDGD